LFASSLTYSGVASTTTAMLPLASSTAKSLARPPRLQGQTGKTKG
jgi:hypothetical protein